MPHHCFENRRSSIELDVEDSNEEDDDLCVTSIWQHPPDLILLHIFSLLELKHLGRVAQTCKTWRRISLDESLWRNLLCRTLQTPAVHLAAGKSCWREEMKRVIYHVPEVLTETLTEHTDEVLHVSFSHNGKLFSTTSKDATLKVWEVGYPTVQKYSKDFRELLAWDFTQFSSFNESDTMVLVSSVKSTHLMDRRGYMAILSLIHDFAILRVVTMDPSQLFGAWLDDTTFLGGSLEISLDRFATTVQIEAHEVPEIYSPQPSPALTPAIEESSGKPLFTFSSETASLIKFLTVTSKVRETNTEADRENLTDCKSIDKYEEILCASNSSESMDKCEDTPGDTGTGVSKVNLDMGTDDLMDKGLEVLPSIGTGVSMEKCEIFRRGTGDGGGKFETVQETDNVDAVDNKEEIFGEKLGQEILDMADQAASGALDPAQAESMPGLVVESSLQGDSVATSVEEMEIGAEFVKCKSRTDNNQQSVGSSLIAHMCGVCVKPMKSTDSRHVCDSCKMPLGECKRPDLLDLVQSVPQDCIKVTRHLKQKNYIEKNLILVTGEFAVALHQIGFKNVPTYSRESVLANGATPMDADNPEGYMVVNYSNNDIHIVHRQQLLDTPDHLIDLFGHVTGLCLTPDQRYLFINCRPWVGDIDRSDPWATPDLSSNIEVRIIDLFTLKDVGVRYKGHKGFSPPNMCCFVFLDVSADFVASGSEDARGYLWDRHYQTHLRSYEHASGVVNAVGFCPSNQEYLVTVSDDQEIKVWRSRSEVKRLNIQLDSSDRVDLEESDNLKLEACGNINLEDSDNINPEGRDNFNAEETDNKNLELRDNMSLKGSDNINTDDIDNIDLV